MISRQWFQCVAVVALLFMLTNSASSLDVESSFQAGGMQAENYIESTEYGILSDSLHMSYVNDSATLDIIDNFGQLVEMDDFFAFPDTHLFKGSFREGQTHASNFGPLPIENDASQLLLYSGGIGIEDGVCLVTGYVDDDDHPALPTGTGAGVEGPNNTVLQPHGPDWGELHATFLIFNDGEVEDYLQANFPQFIDPSHLNCDPSSLQFEVDLTKPGYISIKFVYGSDEYPGTYIVRKLLQYVRLLH